MSTADLEQIITNHTIRSHGGHHTCTGPGCTWTVMTYPRLADPIHRDKNHNALQAAFAKHLLTTATEDTMPRPSTPDVVTVKPGPNGTIRRSRRVTIQRACDGCGEGIGDATALELEHAVAGLPLPSVIAEHGCQTN
jgi:hypothetical protein